MLLGGKFIREAIRNGDWTCNVPLDQLKIGPNSVDVTLGRKILLPKFDCNPVRPDRDSHLFWEQDVTDGFLLMPGKAMLACTNEQFNCDAMLAGHHWVQHYDGRSTFGRLFIASHVTAAFGDYGFKGKWTLEIVNLGPFDIELRPGMRIGQVFFTSVLMPEIYSGAYVDQDGPMPPKLGPGRV